ncbi:DUF2283 domain-containing protein [Patescibacteria group bacterium]|nr:DUF2283 domain-containing protein [Patescibacteria group bacterium]
MKTKQLKKQIHHPKFLYEKEDDVLNIWLSAQKIDYAEQSGDVIIHFTKDNEPVYIEVLDASHFLKRESEDLPKNIKQKFFSAQ